MLPVRKWLTDGLQNLVANLGTSRDKSAQSFYVLDQMSDTQLQTAYRASWLPQKIVDIPAEDAVRNWREWSGSSADTMKIVLEEERLSLTAKVFEAQILARLYGGSAIYINTGDRNPERPLDSSAIAKKGIKSLIVLPRQALTWGDIEYNITNDLFGKPKWWSINAGSEAQPKVHPSRLVFFQGKPIPSTNVIGNEYWGDSILVAALAALQQADATTANIAGLVFEAKIDVISIPNLLDEIQSSDYESRLLKRLTLAGMTKSNNGMFIMDADETYSQKKMTFTTLPEIMDRFFQNVSGAADIPMTRLFGMSPGGMNSTGDSDMMNYYDKITTLQQLRIRPAMAVFDACLVRSALGFTPRTISYAWRPLYQVSEKDKAEAGKLIADTFKVMRDTAIYSTEVLYKASTAAYSEHGLIAGLDEAIASTVDPMAAPVVLVPPPMGGENTPPAPGVPTLPAGGVKPEKVALA